MRRWRRRGSSLWLVGCLVVLAGCAKKEEAAPHPAEAAEAAAPPPEEPVAPSRAPAGTIPREGEAAANPPVHVVNPVRHPPAEEVTLDAGR